MKMILSVRKPAGKSHPVVLFCVFCFLLVGGGPVWSQTCCPDGSSTITAYAGTGAAGYSGDGGPANVARMNSVWGMAEDAVNNLYFCDHLNNVVRKVSAAGIISTLAGNGTAGFSGDGGPAISAQLDSPVFIAADGAGNLYICDFINARVRKVTAGGIISTFAGNGITGYTGDGGPATSASLNQPFGIAVDGAGDVIIADRGNSAIRKVSPAGIITTIAGNGTLGYSGDGGAATSALLQWPEAPAFDTAGNLYFFDDLNYRVRRISTSGIITTVAGTGAQGYTGNNGPATQATLGDVHQIVFCQSGIYLADVDNDAIRRIDASGILATVAGTGAIGDSGDGGTAGQATIDGPQGMAIDSLDNLYIGEFEGNRIREVSSKCPATPTPSFTPTSTPTATYSPTPCGYPGNTCTPTDTPTVTPTVIPADVFTVDKNVFSPSNPVSIYVDYTAYPGSFELRIYNSAGEHIKTLDSRQLNMPWQQAYSWDGTNKYGAPCASGVYVIYLLEPFSAKTKRVILVR